MHHYNLNSDIYNFTWSYWRHTCIIFITLKQRNGHFDHYLLTMNMSFSTFIHSPFRFRKHKENSMSFWLFRWCKCSNTDPKANYYFGHLIIWMACIHDHVNCHFIGLMINLFPYAPPVTVTDVCLHCITQTEEVKVRFTGYCIHESGEGFTSVCINGCDTASLRVEVRQVKRHAKSRCGYVTAAEVFVE